ncbi:PREDICTED: rve domain-containing, partial [Prunus dulcis]
QLTLALVVSARRLRPYFQAHGIKVLTNQPLRQVLQKPEISGRLIKWAIELGEFDIQFVPRPAEKGQAVADFISELTPATVQPTSEAITETILPDQPGTERLDTSTPVWGLHVDGSANQQGCGAGLVLTTPDGLKIEYALRFDFRTSNNEAEYEALLAGLRLAKSMNAKQIRIHSDSQLIVNQVTADFAAKDASMYAYLSTAHQLLRSFQAYEIKQIPRGENSHADALARLASAINDKVGRKVPVEILAQPSTVTSEACAVRYEDTWMSPIYLYLTNGTLPKDKAQARKLRYRSARYTVINDVLYKRGYTTPYLKCLTAEQGEYILREIHGGVCGDHSGSRSLAYKAFRQGYFWPTMHQDANSLVK